VENSNKKEQISLTGSVGYIILL